MNQNITILLVEDHPIITEAYQQGIHLFQENHEELSFEILKAFDCDDALQVLRECKKTKKTIDLIFLDIKIPASQKNPQIKSGEQVGKNFRKVMPTTKIIISTMITGNFLIYNIVKSLDPNGFLIKTDITHQGIIDALQAVLLDGEKYFSKTVTETLLHKALNDYNIEDLERHILHELSVGTKTYDIHKFIPLSSSSVNRRKLKIKDMLGLEQDATDRELILKAKELGII